MKQNLKAVGGYIVNFTKVCILAPVVFVKIMTDTALELFLAFFHALYNEKEATTSTMKEVLEKMN